MIANTDSQTHQFLELRPDWRHGVAVSQRWATLLVPAKDGSEQRSRKLHYPKYGLSYVSRAMSGAEFALRRATVLSELSAALVVPMWTHGFGFLSADGDDVTLNTADLSKQPFRPGSYAYFAEAGLASVFRLVEGKEDNVLTLASGDAAFPAITPPAYTPAALVYPCVVGLRPRNGCAFEQAMVDETAEAVEVEDL